MIIQRPESIADGGPAAFRRGADAHSLSAPDLEAFRELVSLARRKCGAIPEEAIARHVLSVTGDVDWPVRRAALEAVLRRIAFAKRDQLEVASQPPGSARLGLYRTSGADSTLRPYRSVLESVEPYIGRCDCADYLRNSLGLCKHLLIVLDSLHARPRRLELAIAEQGRRLGRSSRLIWDPVRPATGAGDALARIRWLDWNVGAGATRRERLTAAKWFGPDQGGARELKSTFADDPEARRAMVEDLLALVGEAARGGRRDADPALAALLRAERARLDARSRLGGVGSLRQELKGMKQRLFPYQLEGVRRFLSAGRLLLADDMGLGKTAQAIACCHALWSADKAKRGLLIVPASLKPQWHREWHLFTDLPIAVVDGAPAQRRQAYLDQKKGFLIINYEQVLRDLDQIHGWSPDLVVLDEAQRIKNWAAKTSAYVKRLEPAFRLVLTGTPMENRLEELASILDWVDDFALEPKWRLVPWHAVFADGRREVSGARNLETLRSRLGGCMLRRVRQEVLDQLPRRVDVRVPVAMTPPQSEEHDGLKMPIVQLIQRSKRRPLSPPEFLKLMTLLNTQRIIANGLEQRDFESRWPELSRVRRPSEDFLRSLTAPKLLELRELIRNVVLEQGRKAVIFSQWRRMLELSAWAVEGVLAERGLRAAFFTGEEDTRRRTQNIVDLHDDPGTCVLFATDAGGVGLNLQRAASCCINLDLPWNPAVLEQRIGRIHRLGQKQPIDVYNLVAEGSIESRIADLIGTKKAFFSSLFDGKSDEVRFEKGGSFLSQIERVVEPSPSPSLIAPAEAEIEDLAGAEDAAAFGAPPESGPESAAPPPRAAASPAGGPGDGRPLPEPEALRRMFGAIAIEKDGKGGLTLKAPPEAARTLAAVFDGLAGLLRGATAD
jgi:superfamily II DNA or RNA helicase